jgi:ectoine hydroxylase-related dioxygenase (phytanoyl-CoA dioxygenase family)
LKAALALNRASTAGERMLTEPQVREFQTNGYLKGAQVLSDDEVEVLRDEMARVVRDQDKRDVPQPVMCKNLTGNPDAPVWQIVNIWEASEPFRHLVSQPTIVQEMAQLTGASALRIWHDQIQYKPASTGGVNMWHQDAPLWPILAPMTEVSAWVALDDVDPENGCMSMVPGSHLWGNNIEFLNTFRKFDDMPGDFEGKAIEVRPCPVRKGEVHYHHALTWHGSPANTSARPRRAIALHYMTDETRFVASGEHVMKPLVEVADGEVMRGEHFPQVWPVAK